MIPKLTFFPVDNGDMTLLELESGKTILVDINIRAVADDPDDDTPNVATMLRDRLRRDSDGRLYVDAFLLSHPDRDHCTGLKKHFHLGPPSTWSEKLDRILVRELWSSPMVFRRASSRHILCDDAKAFNTEARRRVKLFRESFGVVASGDRVLILGEDENGKTDDLASILIRVDEEFSRVNSFIDSSMTARLLGPLPKSEDETEEEALEKNRSSTILRFSLSAADQDHACIFLTGGDADVGIWERLWQKHEFRSTWLQYNILQAPHHCSWHSLSYDSWSEKGEDAEVCEGARNALSQACWGAVVVASSKQVRDDDSDPPCIRAKREYEAIVGADAVRGSFKCVGDRSEPLSFEILRHGPREESTRMTAPAIIAPGVIGGQPLAHG